MKDVGVDVRFRVRGDGRPLQTDSSGKSRESGPPGPEVEKEGGGGDVMLREGAPKAPDADVQISISVRARPTGDGETPASIRGRVVVRSDVGATWQPDLTDRTELGVTRFTPVSTPWAPTMEGAIEAAKNVKPLPNLSPQVREAESAFRAMVAKDPAAVAQVYLTQVKANRARMVVRLQGAIKAQLAGALEGVDTTQPDAVVGAAETALAQVKGLKPGSQARLMETLSGALRSGSTAKDAVRAMLDRVHVPLKIETDEIKLMSPHFNGQRVNLGDSVYAGADATKIGPAVFNTALHPTATAVARVALELLLEETDGPLVTMGGGVAAGKGFAAQKANFDDSDAAIVFDPDGESSQTFMETVEALAAAHGNEVRMVGVITDPVAAWLRALNRSFEEGRTVSETAFAHSHSTGVENMITSATRMRDRGNDVVLIDNNAWPKLYEGEPPPPMGLGETYGKVKDITDALDQTGRVPDWVRETFGDNDYMMKHVIGPLESKMQEPKRLWEKKAIFDSLKEDRRVFEYAHPHV